VKGRKADLPLPARLDPVHQGQIDRLDALTGRDFAKRYREYQVKAHVEAIAAFEAYASQGKEESLKQWASQTLPKLKDHLAEASSLAISE
jgi:putative membrane protein